METIFVSDEIVCTFLKMSINPRIFHSLFVDIWFANVSANLFKFLINTSFSSIKVVFLAIISSPYTISYYRLKTFLTVAIMGLKFMTVTAAKIKNSQSPHKGGAFIIIMLITTSKPVFVSERMLSNLKGT